MKGGFTLIFHKFHPFFTELNCRKCTNRTSPECPKHPMHTITLHSRIKFSRLDSNQRPFVYQTKTLNHLSYVRMFARQQGLEPRTTVLETVMIPFHHWRIFSQYVKEPKKNPELCSSGSFFIYLMIRLHLIKNPELTAILPLNGKPRLAHVCREITYVMCWVLFHCFLLNINCFTKVLLFFSYVKFFFILLLNFK